MRQIQISTTDRSQFDESSPPDLSDSLLQPVRAKTRLRPIESQGDRVEAYPKAPARTLMMDEMCIVGRDPRVPRAPDGTPMYAQADKRWNEKLLGNSASKDLGKSGCLVTSLAMSLSQKLGRDVTPAELNTALQKEKCFIGASLRVESASVAIKKTYGIDMPLTSSPRNKSWELIPQSGNSITQKVDGELAQGRHVILRLDTNDDDKMNHFALVQRKEGNDYIVIDPAGGKEHRYGLDDLGRFIAKDAYSSSNSGKHYAPQALGYILES